MILTPTLAYAHSLARLERAQGTLNAGWRMLVRAEIHPEQVMSSFGRAKVA